MKNLKNRIADRYEHLKAATGLDGFELSIVAGTTAAAVAVIPLAIKAIANEAARQEAFANWMLEENSSGRTVMMLADQQLVSAPSSELNFFEF